MPEPDKSPFDPLQFGDTIERLDRQVPREGAWVELKQYGGGPDEGRILANRIGFLRLGIEFLKAGVAKDSQASNADGSRDAPIDLEYLVTPDSTISFDSFELRENPPDRTAHRMTLTECVASIGCLLLLIACAGLAIIGFGTVVVWLGG